MKKYRILQFIILSFVGAAIFLILMVKASYAATLPSVEFTVKSFVVEGDNQLSQQRTTQILREFLGKHEGLERLRSAAKALENGHAQQGNSFYRVTLPPQTMTILLP